VTSALEVFFNGNVLDKLMWHLTLDTGQHTYAAYLCNCYSSLSCQLQLR